MIQEFNKKIIVDLGDGKAGADPGKGRSFRSKRPKTYANLLPATALLQVYRIVE